MCIHFYKNKPHAEISHAQNFVVRMKDKYINLSPVLGNTLLEVAGVVLPLLRSLLILYSRELILYSIFYSETRYSTRILLKSIQKF